MTTNDLILLRQKLRDFILLLCDLSRSYDVSDVCDVLTIIDVVIKLQNEED